MTSQQFLVCDSSTLANFKSWGSAISGFFTTAGWTKSADTGQVNWSTIATVPGSNVYVYEIWEPNDGLTNFYARVEYGNSNLANSPSLRLSLGASTDGAGNLTGLFTGTQRTNTGSGLAGTTTATYECDLSGAAGRITALLWRNGPAGVSQMFGIERSVSSGGAYTSSYVTLYTAGGGSAGAVCQNTLVFGVGTAIPGGIADAHTGFAVRSVAFGSNNGNTSFNGGIPIDLAAPVPGYFDYCGTSVGVGWGADIAEGVTFTATVYGSTRTYMPTKSGYMAYVGPGVSAGASSFGFALCVRYD